jgi:hypothetical protein
MLIGHLQFKEGLNGTGMLPRIRKPRHDPGQGTINSSETELVNTIRQYELNQDSV